MPGRILPYTAAETAAAADWLTYLAVVRETVATDPDCSVNDLDDETVEHIDKLRRRGCITGAVASLLAEIFDVVLADSLALA